MGAHAADNRPWIYRIDDYRPALSPRSSGRSVAEMTVEQIYTDLFEPAKRDAGTKQSSIRDWHTHVRRWSEYWLEHRINNPMAGSIGYLELVEWRTWLSATLKGANVPRNVNKHVATVRAVLSWCQRRGLIQTAPWCESLEAVTTAPKKYLSHEGYVALDAACAAAGWPAGLDPPASVQWRAALRLYVLYGFRTQELIAFESSHTALRWADLHPPGLSPADGSQVESRHGWIRYVPEKQRRKKRDPLVLPVHAEAAVWIDRLRHGLPDGADDDRPLFPWPRGGREFYRAWRRITARAAELIGRPDLGEVDIKHLRKTCATWHETATPGIAEHITGHGDRTVIQRHYVNHERALVDHFEKFRLPEVQGDAKDAGADTTGGRGALDPGRHSDQGDLS